MILRITACFKKPPPTASLGGYFVCLEVNELGVRLTKHYRMLNNTKKNKKKH